MLRGGAPEAEFNKFEVLRLEIDSINEMMVSKAGILNALVDEMNALNSKIQAEAKKVNNDVNIYNNSDLIGKEFEQGLYSSRGYTKEINIFQFDSRAKLLKVVEHELGHALGLEHNQSTSSIMYMTNVDSATKISPDDLAQIKKNCRQEDKIDILLDWVMKVIK